MAEGIKKQKDESESRRRNPPTEKVPEGGVINPHEEPKVEVPKDVPEGTVEQDAQVWEGGDPGEGLPSTPNRPDVDQTYWHEGEADQVNPGTPAPTPSPTPSPPPPSRRGSTSPDMTLPSSSKEDL